MQPCGESKEWQMARVVVINHVTLDGVMQAPGRLDEDPRNGFEHGGWAIPGTDEVMGQKLAGGMAKGGGLLLGRRTYEDFYGFWPNQPDNPFTDVLNTVPKYVASRTLTEPVIPISLTAWRVTKTIPPRRTSEARLQRRSVSWRRKSYSLQV
jgi:dihydrofolate reductase